MIINLVHDHCTVNRATDDNGFQCYCNANNIIETDLLIKTVK